MPTDLIILAGGRSSRMGEDKLLLRRNGRLLIEDWIERINWPSTPLLVLPPGAAAPGELCDLRTAHDAIADQGPLQGVLTALRHRQSDWQLIVPIDMPRLERSHLDWLVGQIQSDVIARLWMMQRPIGSNCAIEPFPLLIHADLLPAIESRLSEGRRSLQKLADEPAARVIDAPADWSEQIWLNLNRPEELERFLRDPGEPKNIT